MGTTSNPLASPVSWDLVAGDYDREARVVFDRYARSALDLASPPIGARVLDVCCGSGALTLAAAPTAARVDAIDFSPEMLARLDKHLRDDGIANVHVHNGDGQALPFVDTHFDAAFSMFGLMFFPDRAAGYRELHRVLVPGGRATVSSWQSFEHVPIFVRVFAAIAEADPTPAPPPRPLPLATAEEHVAEMSAAGFVDVRVSAVTHTQEAPSVSAYWESMQRTNVMLVLAQRRIGGDAWRPISEHVQRSLVEHFGPGPLSLPFPAWIAVGTKP